MTKWTDDHTAHARLTRAMHAGFILAGWMLVAAFGVFVFSTGHSTLGQNLVYIASVLFTASLLLWVTS